MRKKMPKTKNTPHKSLPLFSRVIGYARVSSKAQERDGNSLDAQADRIRTWAQQSKTPVLGIFDDAGSAYKTDAPTRHGLEQALDECRTHGCPLVVTRVDRLSRNVSDIATYGLNDIVLVSIEEGHVSGKTLRLLIQKAHEQSAAKALQASGARQSRRPGNVSALRHAQRKGSARNVYRKNLKIARIVDHGVAHPGLWQLSIEKMARHLNDAGVLNLKSYTKGTVVPWTYHSLQKCIHAARDAYDFRCDDDAEPMTLEVVENAAAAPCVVPGASDSTGGPLGARVASEATIPAHGATSTLALSAGAPVGPVTASVPVGSVTNSLLKRPPSIAAPMLASTRPGCRGLTNAEKEKLKAAMVQRGLSQSDVMDEIGLKRLNPSIWMALSNGTNVAEDFADKLSAWLDKQDGQPAPLSLKKRNITHHSRLSVSEGASL